MNRTPEEQAELEIIEGIEKDWYLTVVTSNRDESEFTYFFGRRDMSDGLRPTKVQVKASEPNRARAAWLALGQSLTEPKKV